MISGCIYTNTESKKMSIMIKKYLLAHINIRHVHIQGTFQNKELLLEKLTVNWSGRLFAEAKKCNLIDAIFLYSVYNTQYVQSVKT